MYVCMGGGGGGRGEGREYLKFRKSRQNVITIDTMFYSILSPFYSSTSLLK